MFIEDRPLRSWKTPAPFEPVASCRGESPFYLLLVSLDSSLWSRALVSHVRDPCVRVLHFSFCVLSLNVLSQSISLHSQFRRRRSPT